MITLHYNNTTLQVQEDDSSFHYKAIMGDNSVTLKFSLNEAIDFPVGTYIVFNNAVYTLTSPEKWSRHGNENIEYTMVLEGVQSSLKKYKLRNQQDGRLKFGMNATPAEFLQLIVDNLNQTGRETGWTGVCTLTAESKTIEFNHDFLASALTAIAEAFETEYEITDAKIIRLGKVEYNKTSPLPLAYGRGNGFKPGTGRANSNDSHPVEILYVQGGERNIDRSKYGSAELHLPKSGRITHEGVVYEADEDGVFIKKADVAPVYGNEDSFDGSDIYPKRVGEVSSVIVKDAAKHFYDFVDSSIPAGLDYNEQLIAGETMTVIFQSGMLAGKEFEISKYDHTARRFEIVPQEIDGIAMPDDTWKPVTGDRYAIFGCTLPDSYINDSGTQTGAEWDLFREAARYLYDNKDFKFTFTGELQGKWARENWIEGLGVSSKLVIGGYIRFTDTHFAPLGVDIRIVGVKTFLCDPYAPTIEISNSIASAATFSSELRKPDAQEVKIEQGYRDAISFTKRRWRDANETMEMLEESLLANFTSRISPIAVNTMQLLVGDESLQYVFVDSETEPQSVIVHTETWNNATKTFTMGAGILKHMTLGITELAGMDTHALSDYKYWNIPANDFVLASAALAEKSYYLYAKCAKNGTTGEFVASETAIAMEGVPGYYHFLVGILNSEFDGDRSYVPMYGFTEILPGRITTDKIVSGQGTTFWDLVANVLNLGGKLQYNTQESGAGNLLLKGTLVQTGSGEPTVISAYCGDYDATRVYQLGDIVSYTAGGVTSTYRYVNSVASSGHLPTDTNYWKVETAGTAGQPGYNQATIMLYKRSSTPITAIDWSGSLYYVFSTNSLEATPQGWSRSIPSGTDPVYVTMVSITSRDDRVQITNDKWPNPVELVENGTNGRGIVSTVVEYSVDNQGATAPSSNWQDTIPAVSPGYYLWTRTTITYTSGNPSVSYSVSRAGSNGNPGSNGYSTKYLYKSQDNQPATPTGTSPSPSGWSGDPTPATTAATLTQKQYVGEWEKQTSGTYNNYYKCPPVGDDASSRESFFFETFQENTIIKLDVAIACEANYDFLLIGKVDETPFYDPDDDTYGGYEHFVTSDVSGTMKTVQVTLKVKRAGVHKIDFLFCKDHSQTNVDDVYVKYNSLYREYKVWMTSCKVQDGSASDWTTPICINGDNGANADAAAACVYRGEYNKNPQTGRSEVMTYWGLSARTDIVYYNGRYYRTNPCVGGSFSDILPTNTAYWMDFGANFDSVATGFLFAEEAVIEKAVVRKLRTNDTGARIQASGISLKMIDADDNVKLNIVGSDLGSVPTNQTLNTTQTTILNTYYSNGQLRGKTKEVSGEITLKTFSVTDDANTITLTTLSIYCNVRVGNNPTGYASAYMEFDVLIDDEVINDMPEYADFDFASGEPANQDRTLTFSGLNTSVESGTHTMKIRYYITCYGSPTWSSDSDFNISVYAQNGGILQIQYAIQKVEVGANGFRAMFSGSQFAEFVDDNGTPTFLIRNGNYCLKIASDGIKKSTNGGSSWTNL